MKKKNLLQLMKMLIIVLSVLLLVTGCFPKAADNKDDNGSKVASGVYFYRLKIDGQVTAKKMLLMK